MNVTITLFQIDFDRLGALAVNVDQQQNVWTAKYDSRVALIRTLEQTRVVTAAEIAELKRPSCFAQGGQIFHASLTFETSKMPALPAIAHSVRRINGRFRDASTPPKPRLYGRFPCIFGRRKPLRINGRLRPFGAHINQKGIVIMGVLPYRAVESRPGSERPPGRSSDPELLPR